LAAPANNYRRQRRAPLPPLSAAWRRLAATAATIIDYHLAAAAADADSGIAEATPAAVAAATDVDRLGGAVSCAPARRIAEQEKFLSSSGGGGGGAGGGRKEGESTVYHHAAGWLTAAILRTLSLRGEF